jgi:CRP-like cAMP-binding protein
MRVYLPTMQSHAMKTLEIFLATNPVRKFCKYELLVQQEDELHQAYVIKTGAVRCYDISLDGNQQLILIMSEGELFPASVPLEAETKARFFYSAFVDSEVYVVNRRRLLTFLHNHPSALLDVYTDITHKLTDLQYRVGAIAKPKAREKILHTLAFIADRFRDRRNGQQVEVSLPLTHQDIADLVGLTRETTTATLRTLRAEGFVSYDRQRFLIHRDKIQETLW